MLLDREIRISNFKKYQEQLVYLNEQESFQSFFIDKVYDNICELQVGKIDIDKFVKNIQDLYENIKSIKH